MAQRVLRGTVALVALVGLLALILSTPIAFAGASGVAGGVTGLTSCAGGDALADNEVMRADGTTGCQGATVTLSDANVFATTTVNGNLGIAPNGTGDVVLTLDTQTSTFGGAGLRVDAGSSGELVVNKGAAGDYGTLHFYTAGVSKYLVQHDNTDALVVGRASGPTITFTAAAPITVSTTLAITAQATAPATCSIGHIYSDTSGAMCACTAANTWSNMTATGACA